MDDDIIHRRASSGVQISPPERLLCKFCSNLLKNAVNLPCCQQLVCRGCAVKNIIKNKSQCVLPTCLKPSAISGLKGNNPVRAECEQYAEHFKTINNSTDCS